LAASPPALPGTGRIAGFVVGAETGLAVRFATITLCAGDREQQARTDQSGAFAFEGLGPDDYTLHVAKPGYLETIYGQSRPGTATPGRTIRLRAGEQFDRLQISLSFGSAISGVVSDDRGEPAFQATVTASRWVVRDGRHALEPVAEAETDERGRYRLSLLPPRAYIVSAVMNSLPPPRGAAQRSGFAPAFYPAASEADDATAIDVTIGDERINVDLHLLPVTFGHVVGTVVDPRERPVGGTLVSLLRMGAPPSQAGLAIEADASGRFVADDLIPGTYVARVKNHQGADPRESLQPRRPEGTVSSEFVVTSGSRSDIVLQLATPPATRQEPKAEVAGIVRDPAGQPVGDRVIVLFPTDERLWSQARVHTQAALLARGGFSFSGIAPGSYQIGVVENVEPDEWLTPQLLRQVLQASVGVIVAAGDRRILELRAPTR
jgi:hypothetical protein